MKLVDQFSNLNWNRIDKFTSLDENKFQILKNVKFEEIEKLNQIFKDIENLKSAVQSEPVKVEIKKIISSYLQEEAYKANFKQHLKTYLKHEDIKTLIGQAWLDNIKKDDKFLEKAVDNFGLEKFVINLSSNLQKILEKDSSFQKSIDSIVGGAADIKLLQTQFDKLDTSVTEILVKLGMWRDKTT